MKFNENCICMVCHKPIETYVNGRVEWINKSGRSITDIHICHDECSAGYRGLPVNLGDWIFSQYYGGEEYVYTRLQEMKQENPDIGDKIKAVEEALFD